MTNDPFLIIWLKKGSFVNLFHVLLFVLLPADCCPLVNKPDVALKASGITALMCGGVYVAFLLSDTQDHYLTHSDPCTLKDILATVDGFSYRLDSTIIHLQSSNIQGLNRSMMVCCNSKKFKL